MFFREIVPGSKRLSAKPTRLADVTNASRAIKRCHYNLRCLNDVDVVEADAHKKIRPCKNAPEIYGRPCRGAFMLRCSCSRGKQIFPTPVIGGGFCFRNFSCHPIFDVTRSSGSTLYFHVLNIFCWLPPYISLNYYEFVSRIDVIYLSHLLLLLHSAHFYALDLSF